MLRSVAHFVDAKGKVFIDTVLVDDLKLLLDYRQHAINVFLKIRNHSKTCDISHLFSLLIVLLLQLSETTYFIL